MLEPLTLKPVRQLTSHCRLVRNDAGLEILLIERPEAEAAVSLFGAHLLHYAKAGQPITWLSPLAVLDGSRAIRGGIPLCWPWFGPAPARVGTGKPQHGFARTAFWQLDGISEHADGTLVHLALEDSEQSRALWPHPFRLELDILIGPALTMVLSTRNTGQQALIYSGAMHSYFTIASPELAKVSGIGTRYQDQLEGGQIKELEQLSVDGPIDRIYTAPEPVVTLETGKLKLTLAQGQADSVVVWTPWKEGARNMADVNDDAWQQMLCVETAITAPDGILVAPGEEHSLSLQLSVTTGS